MNNSAFIAVTDPSTQSGLFSLLSLIVTTLGTFGVAWIALQHAKLAKTVQILEKNTNSMKDQLMASTAKASHAEGILQEKALETKRKGDVAEAMLNVNVSVKGEKLATDRSQVFTEPTVPAIVLTKTDELARAIKAVPDRTAVKVVEKLEEKKGQ